MRPEVEDAVVPRESLRLRLRRYLLSWYTLKPITRWLFTGGLFLGLVFIAVFVAAAIALDSLAEAWEVLVTVRSPFDTKNHAWALALQLVGYLLVPAAVGAAVGLAVDARVSRHFSDEAALRRRLEQRVLDLEIAIDERDLPRNTGGE